MATAHVQIDEIVDQCLLTCLSDEGHAVYLRDPLTHEVKEIIGGASWHAAEQKRRTVRRIVCHILDRAIQELLR